MENKEIRPIRLRVELKGNYLSDLDKVMLKRYGESSTGDSIIRDLIIPSDLPLHNLHYVMQKAFGWQNSHLREFVLPDAIYHELTNGTVKGWTELVGVLFQPPSEGYEDIFWDDTFNSDNRSSFTPWLKRKYTGPYSYGGFYEQYENAREDISQIVDETREFEVRESFRSWSDRKKIDPNAEIRILKTARFMDMTLEELRNAVAIENGTDKLMERLLVDDVLAYQGEKLGTDEQFPVTHELTYRYDFGDGWEVTITKYDNYDDLLDNHIVFEQEVREIENLVLEKHKPYCIHRDGLSVMDDVGGLSGYAQFLGNKYEQINLDMNLKDLNAWATSMGWRPTKTVPRELI